MKAEWPLFTGFSRTASLNKANLQRQIAINELQNFKVQTQAEVQELEQNYRNARQSLNQYRQHFALYQDNYSIARYKYTHEVFTVDQLLQVYGEQLKSQNLYLNALANYYVNFALLQIKNQYSQTASTATYGN